MFSNVVRSGGWRDGGGCGGRRSFLVEREAPGTSRVAAPWSDGRRRTTKSKDQAPSVGWLACNEQRRGRVKRTSVLVGRSARGRTITVKQVSSYEILYTLPTTGVKRTSEFCACGLGRSAPGRTITCARPSRVRSALGRRAPGSAARPMARPRCRRTRIHARDRHPADPSGR